MLASLAPLAAIVIPTSEAVAQCVPAASAGLPAAGTTVTCSGSVLNQNNPNGYGDSTQNGITINVTAGASVTGTNTGIALGSGNTVNNSGAISGSSTGIFGGILTVNNSGSIQALNRGINAAQVTVTNSGTISGGDHGIFGSVSTDLVNSGTIAGGGAGGDRGVAGARNIVNTGIITAGAKGIAISAANLLLGMNVNNSGTISSGFTGIAGSGVITNSGTISGTGHAAIDFSNTPGGNTLNLLPGSRLLGNILLGAGDTVNIQTGAGIASVLTFGNAGVNGLVDTGSTVHVTAGVPFVVNGDQVAVLEPTAFALADRTLMDFTGGMSSLVASRFAGMATPGASFGNGALVASYAAEPRFAATLPMKAQRAIDDAVTVWADGFGAGHWQQADGLDLRATHSYAGGALGVDALVAPQLRMGVYLGGGFGRLGVASGSQTIDSNYLIGGIYGRLDLGAPFIDFVLSGGGARNASTRQVASNLAPGGIETATASYDSRFVSPELVYGWRVAAGNGWAWTPAARARYVAGWFDGYSEAGSAQSLTVASRLVQDIEGRLELAVTHTLPLAAGGAFTTQAKIGALALARLGDTTVNTVLIGQTLPFLTPGKNDAEGVYVGLGADWRLNATFSAFVSAEGTWLTDSSTVATAKGGIAARF
jgi:hypothetical protein